MSAIRNAAKQYKDWAAVLRRYRTLWLGSTVLIALTSLSELAVPLLSIRIIDEVFPLNNGSLLALLCLGIAGTLTVYSFSRALTGYVMTYCSDRVLLLVQRTLIRHVTDLPLDYYHTHSAGEITADVMHGSWMLEPMLTTAMLEVIQTFCTFMLALGFISALDWKMFTLALGSIIVAWVSSKVWAVSLRSLHGAIAQRKTEAVSRLTESLEAFYLEKIFCQERSEARRVFQRLVIAAKARQRARFYLAMKRRVSELIVAGLSLGFLWVGGMEVMRGTISLGEYVALNALLVTAHGAALTLLEAGSSIAQSAAGLARVDALLSKRRECSGRVTLQGKIATIRCSKVSFGFDDRPLLFKDLSFEMRRGETIGISGPSGCGKTTLVNLFLRFYDPGEGRLEIGNYDVRELDLRDLRRQFAVVPQDVSLFCGTINENICYGKPRATRAEVERAADFVGLHSFILGLQDGYDTVLDFNGGNLSAGQQQRLGIARAILCEPQILILDEATSALDAISEADVMRRLESFLDDRMALLISHRPSVLSFADRILCLPEGRMVVSNERPGLLPLPS